MAKQNGTTQSDRTHTTDLREGLGLFRWGDTKAQLLKRYPDAGFGSSALYAHKSVVNVTIDIIGGIPLLACIDPDKTTPRLLVMCVPMTFDNTSEAEVDAEFAAWMAEHGQQQAPGQDGEPVAWEFDGLQLEWSREDGPRVWVERRT